MSGAPLTPEVCRQVRDALKALFGEEYEDAVITSRALLEEYMRVTSRGPVDAADRCYRVSGRTGFIVLAAAAADLLDEWEAKP